ncbi:MAG: small-conductance mechanosensitive channel, partial [Bradymonadia bacterium]
KQLSHFIIGYAFCLLPARLLERDAIGAFAFARAAWIAYGVLVFLIVLRVTRPENPLLKGLGESNRALRVASMVRWGLRILIVAIVGMEVLGYQYGARWLARRLAFSAVVVTPLAMIYLAFVTRLRARSVAGARGLLAVCVLAAGIGVALIWGVDEGAIRLLGAVSIFGQGKGAISLLDLGSGLFVLGITVLVLRFIPRLFKMTLFRAITLDEGIEYAIITITRYVAFFIGLVAVFSALTVNFEKLGWLVATLGVGLGFGLQEIVSNFVSGIIILVERPVKVGDFVSIGALDGRVLNINIRSTTLLSLDRREFIVPNKDLITKDVTNWTRTDRVVRITVPIGVAYGSDVPRVIALLDAAARGIPGVMQIPSPEVLFMAHGDSSLDFEVRVHVPDPHQRFTVLNAVNSAINATLAKSGIAIPFPQRDVHLFYENAPVRGNGSLQRVARADDAAPKPKPGTEPSGGQPT